MRFVRFKQHPLNINHKFEFSYYLIDGERLLPVAPGIVRFSINKSLDFHDVTFSVLPSLFKVS